MQTSASLIERLSQSPSESDWRRLHDLYEPLLQTWIARAGVARADADDLTQEVMIVIVKEVSSFVSLREGSFRAWLRVIRTSFLYGSILKTRPMWPANSILKTFRRY